MFGSRTIVLSLHVWIGHHHLCHVEVGTTNAELKLSFANGESVEEIREQKK
jgi:hypothetical protein